MKACAFLNVAVAMGLTTFLVASGCGGSRGPADAPAPEPEGATAEEGSLAPDPGAEPETLEGEGSTSGGSGEPTPAPPAEDGEDTRTTESIANEVKLHRDSARDCYDRVSKNKNLPAGDLVLHFVLNPDGSVKEIKMNAERSTLKDPDLVECVSNIVKAIKFPESSRGMETSVNYPFNFNPRQR